MNRTIKFRGKSLATGEWLHGSHFFDGAEDYILPNLPSGAIDYEDYQVDLNTLGQFTGLHDREGREIYEGDVIQAYTADSNYPIRMGKIEFSKGVFAFCYGNIMIPLNELHTTYLRVITNCEEQRLHLLFINL